MHQFKILDYSRLLQARLLSFNTSLKLIQAPTNLSLLKHNKILVGIKKLTLILVMEEEK